jgi:hypothetical protein
MEKIDNVILYIDDRIIHFQTHEQHLAAIDVVMSQLFENGIKINLSKFFWKHQSQLSGIQADNQQYQIKQGYAQIR